MVVRGVRVEDHSCCACWNASATSSMWATRQAHYISHWSANIKRLTCGHSIMLESDCLWLLHEIGASNHDLLRFEMDPLEDPGAGCSGKEWRAVTWRCRNQDKMCLSCLLARSAPLAAHG